MNAVFAGIFKLVFAAAAMIFAASLLLALMAVLVLSSLWSLLNGRKPQVAVLWTRYRDLTRGLTPQSPWSAGRQTGPVSRTDVDIVDVQVKEVPEPTQRLPR